MPDLNRGAVQVLHRVTGGRLFAPDLTGGDAPEWMAAAVCSSSDPELWFPEKGQSTAPAKAICRGCPSRVECLQYALDNNERFGVWGALSERERRRLSKGQPAEQPDRRVQPGECPHCGKYTNHIAQHIASVHPQLRRGSAA